MPLKTKKYKNQDQSQSQDQSQENDQQQYQKIQIKKPKIEKLDQMKNLKKIIINVSMTQYPVVTQVAEELGWKIQTSLQSGDWDLFWTDFHIEPDVLIKMHLFQKINHFPGIQTLARKNLLGLNLMAMRQVFPQEYNFFPLTWMLPQQYVEFRNYFQTKQKGKTRTYIVKPQADCQGRGIFLTRKLQSIQNGKHYVVQRYITKPYLIDNLKFDMRIYVLLGSINPLRIYLYDEGLARFATQSYVEPSTSNLEKQYIHLTNYAINKKNPKFIFNTNASNMNIGHKRSIKSVFNSLQTLGANVPQLKSKIKDLIIKTIITCHPIISHQYKYSQPQDYTGNMCFHILGFDVMLKNNLDPILLQVNHTPSFTTDTPLDYKIKKNLIKDTLNIMNINIKKKEELYNRSMENIKVRLLTGKRNILEGGEREQLIGRFQKQREEYEMDKKKNNLGGFEVIFPSKDEERMEVYKMLLEHANKQYFQQKGSIRMKLAQKQSKKIARQEFKQRKKQKQMSQQQNTLKQTNIKGDSSQLAKQSTKINNLKIPQYDNIKQKSVKKSTRVSQAIASINDKNNAQSIENQESQSSQKQQIQTQERKRTIDIGEISIFNHSQRKQNILNEQQGATRPDKQINEQLRRSLPQNAQNILYNKTRNVKSYSENIQQLQQKSKQLKNYSSRNKSTRNNNQINKKNKNIVINDPYQVYQTYLSANGPMIHQVGNQIISNLMNNHVVSRNKYQNQYTQSQNGSKIGQYAADKISQLPTIDKDKTISNKDRQKQQIYKDIKQKDNQNQTQLFNKANIMKKIENQKKRYVKGSANTKSKQISRLKGLSGYQPNQNHYNYNNPFPMTKSTGVVNIQAKNSQLNHKQQSNLSGLITRKRIQQKIITSNKRFQKDNQFLNNYDNKIQINKIIYKGYHHNTNTNNRIQSQIQKQKQSGQFLMPKIFCLNFQPERNQPQVSKFLLIKNLDIQGK